MSQESRNAAALGKPGLLSCVEVEDCTKMPAPVITYVEPVEIAKRAGGSRSKTSRRKCRHCRSKRGKPLSARARRERRSFLAQLDALPIARRARAAGLHGPALRAYVAAVEALDGTAALME